VSTRQRRSCGQIEQGWPWCPDDGQIARVSPVGCAAAETAVGAQSTEACMKAVTVELVLCAHACHPVASPVPIKSNIGFEASKYAIDPGCVWAAPDTAIWSSGHAAGAQRSSLGAIGSSCPRTTWTPAIANVPFWPEPPERLGAHRPDCPDGQIVGRLLFRARSGSYLEQRLPDWQVGTVVSASTGHAT